MGELQSSTFSPSLGSTRRCPRFTTNSSAPFLAYFWAVLSCKQKRWQSN
jgi:hypothetical protein